jgi:hypothetical protein
MWVVVNKSSRYHGQVGQVSSADWKAATLDSKLEVQFGNSGPLAKVHKTSLIPVRDIVQQIERFQGCNYHADTDD